MDLVDLHRRALEEFDRRVAGVRGEQWSAATPCADWDVRALVNHLVYEDRWTVPLLQGATVEDVGTRFDGDLLGDDPPSVWRDAMAAARDAVAAPGALEGDVNVSWGKIPASEYVQQLFSDHLVHAWDLARATGADEELDAELVAACYDIAKPQEDFLKSTGAFGELVEPPPGADLQTKLLAVYGRVA